MRSALNGLHVRWVSRCASEAPLWCTKPLFGYQFASCLRIAHCALHDPLWVLMRVACCALRIVRPTLGLDVRCVLRIVRCATHFGCGCALRIAYCAHCASHFGCGCALRVADSSVLCALRDPLWVWMCVVSCVLCVARPTLGVDVHCVLRPTLGTLWVWMRACELGVAHCALRVLCVARFVRCALCVARCALRIDLGLHENT